MQLEKCAALHPYAMILREKDMDRQDYRELARHIQVMCREASVKMFVHSDISVAEQAVEMYIFQWNILNKCVKNRQM